MAAVESIHPGYGAEPDPVCLPEAAPPRAGPTPHTARPLHGVVPERPGATTRRAAPPQVRRGAPWASRPAATPRRGLERANRRVAQPGALASRWRRTGAGASPVRVSRRPPNPASV